MPTGVPNLKKPSQCDKYFIYEYSDAFPGQIIITPRSKAKRFDGRANTRVSLTATKRRIRNKWNRLIAASRESR